MAKTENKNKGNDRPVTWEALELYLKKLTTTVDLLEKEKKAVNQTLETLNNQLRATVDQLALLKERNRLR